METSSLIFRNCDKFKVEANAPGKAVQRDWKLTRLGGGQTPGFQTQFSF